MEESRVTIIIPSYNGRHLLEKNLPKVMKASSTARICVVDDGSTDATASWLASHYPQVAVKVLAENMGFVRAVNFGVAHAKTAFIVLLNNDAVPHRGWLAPLLAHFRDPAVFATACKEMGKWGNREVESGRSIGEFKKGFLVHSRGKDAPYTLWASGGSALFDRKKWVELSGMDTIFAPFYWEDIDLSYRAWKRGLRVEFEPRSVVTHHHASTIALYYPRRTIRAVSIKNQFLFVWKNITDKNLLAAHIAWLPIHLLRACMRLDGAFLHGFLWALFLLPKSVMKRMPAHAIVMTDGQVLALHRKDEK